MCGQNQKKDMKYNKALVYAFALLAMGCSAAQAQDKQTLDLLVSKGLITRAEADKVSKSSVAVVPAEKAAKKIKISGRLQGQYEFINTDQSYDNMSDNTSSFILRRIFLGATADLGSGWKGEIIADFAAKDYIEKAFISKNFKNDYLNGDLDFGYKKINFSVEETTSSSKLISIERSLATRYFAEGNNGRRLGVAARHVGIFYNGKILENIEGLKYGFSITNAYNGGMTKAPANATNGLMYAANVLYSFKVDDAKFTTGLNLAYANSMNVAGEKGNVGGYYLGFNPYIKGSFKGFDFFGEFLAADMENGIYSAMKDNFVMGANLGVEYKFDIGEFGKIAPVVRLSWLDTDGRGIKMSDGVRDADLGGVGKAFSRGKSIYVGLNWYIMGNTVKYQLGYEYAYLDGAAYGATDYGNSSASAVRTQIQILF